jgi:hypothetical protein
MEVQEPLCQLGLIEASVDTQLVQELGRSLVQWDVS